MTTENKRITINNAGHIENLRNAMFSNDLLAVLTADQDRIYLSISSVQQEDGSSNGYNIEGSIVPVGVEEKWTKVQGYLKYTDRSKPGTGSIKIST